ncbi:MAG TPA: hypothetical protein VGC14_09155 [Rhizobium sp.]
MAITEDHSVIGAHAHANRRGWVSMASIVTFIGVPLFAFVIFSGEQRAAAISPAPSC